ncbi:MAG: hypothetical protein R3185_07920 [Candidatus Thermoplasmatota archaeon]|nr:hypothetical protein [Candidatus Thermoplasmatota archaeon]
MPSPWRPSFPAALTLGTLAVVPAALMLFTAAGRELAADDFLHLQSLGTPASLALAGSAFLLSIKRLPWPLVRAAQTLLALSGLVLAFVAAQVLATVWLLWGRAILEPIFKQAGVTSLLAVIAGGAGVVLGSRVVGFRAGRTRTGVALAGLGAVAVPAFPWFIIGDARGFTVLLFTDFTAPLFSRFPGDLWLEVAVWTVAGSLVAMAMLPLLAGALGRWPGTPARLAACLGLLGVFTGYGIYLWRTVEVTKAFPGHFFPLFNYVPLALALVAAYQLWRGDIRPPAAEMLTGPPSKRRA